MPSTISLLNNLRDDFPQITFQESDCFRWSPDTKVLYFDLSVADFYPYVLHELGHAMLAHASYRQDVDLIKIERSAWDYAKSHLAEIYSVIISEELIEENLDTYREWLHRRSACPSCTMTGFQATKGHYICLACGNRWRTNEARSCALRRYRLSQT